MMNIAITGNYASGKNTVASLFRDILKSENVAIFDADVIDIELLYDNAMLAVDYEQANKYGIKYILAGTNTSTEGMKMPKNWNWFKGSNK